MSTTAPEAPSTLPSNPQDDELDAERDADADPEEPSATKPSEMPWRDDDAPEQLALPMIGGDQVDIIRVKFKSRTIALDRSEPRDVAFWRDLYRLGKSLEMRVSVEVDGTGADRISAGVDETVNAGEIRLLITDLHVLTPEEL